MVLLTVQGMVEKTREVSYNVNLLAKLFQPRQFTLGRFKVLPGNQTDPQMYSIRLQNVAQSDKYLTIRPQYCVGYVSIHKYV